ncbi:MAG: reprolysin-like metallopeptidase [Bacteroidota bacterium]
MKKAFLFLVGILCYLPAFSQTNRIFWSDVSETQARSQTNKSWILPKTYRAVQLDREGFERKLRTAPPTNSRSSTTPLVIVIPMPDGTNQRFAVKASNILHPRLAAKFPAIRTYSGKGLEDANASIHLDMTPQGFHGMILSPNGTVFIDPLYQGRDDYYATYYKRDFEPTEKFVHTCEVRQKEVSSGLVQDHTIKQESPASFGTARMATINMRTYRIAIGANRQYTAFHGGTVQGGLAAITTALTRVTGVYEDELAVSFQLVANNDQVVFTNASNDPYSNNANAIDQNRGVLNNAIGSTNYDIGHVFTTGSGGVAGLGVVCSNDKAAGTTGLGQPTGDPFYIDFVAHEIGHQFGGNHTFNGDSGSCSGGNRNRSTAYEPGSGSTIQAYAGICGNDNLQNNSDPYFHLISLNEMRRHVTQESGANCGTLGNQNNTTPVANANAENINNKSIPARTPFELTGTATDANGDALTYNWEQWNLGAQSDLNSPASGAPLFRSFEPTTSPTRIFPKLQNVLSNTNSSDEQLPTGNRTLNFQFIARDNNTAGGYDSDMITLQVVGGAGPFKINSPNSATTLSGATTVTWDVAGTNNSPINCSAVDIFLSLDGGQTFTQQLADDVANNGSATVTLPNVNVTTARLKIKCANNVFLDINDANFTIEPSSANPCTITDLAAGSQTACNVSTGKYTQQVTVTYADAPNQGTLVVNGQSFSITGSPQTVTLTDLTANGNSVNVTANFSANTTCSRTENNLFTAPASCLPVCAITAITAGSQTACNASTNFYTQEVTVTYENAPNGENLVVNGQSFSATSSPQTVTLVNLVANGNNVSVTANFATSTSCSLTANNLFQAPASCTPVCAITNITAGAQTACNTTNNTYDQTITITYVNPPSTGNLVVNNQEFGITSSPQTVTLTGLNANGNTVDVTAFFRTNQNCTFTQNTLFTAPAACVTDLCQEYIATDVPKNISANGTPTVTSTLTIAQAGIITDVNVKDLFGEHTFIYDLDISLTSPNGTTVLLVSEACFGEIEDFDLNVDDNGTASGCPITGGDTYAPIGSLADFNGEQASGTWTLTVEDFFDLDGGSLDGWTLDICTVAGGSNCGISSITAGNQLSCDPNTNTFSQVLTVTYADPPTTGTLLVNGQSFEITESPQAVTLTGLSTDGASVNVTASFSAASSCALTVNSLFNAPVSCDTPTCTETNSTDTPITIPDPFNQVVVTSTINITETRDIVDVNVKNLRGTHYYVGDLKMELTSPAGTTVQLIRRKCSYHEDFNMNFDDDGSKVRCPLTGGKTFKPKGSLAAFNGETPTGNWVLKVTDVEGLEGGTLDGWTLEICTGTPASTVNVNNDPINPDTYLSCEYLFSSGKVATNTSVTFRANTAITLSPGFIAEAGCNFSAVIDDCLNTFGAPITELQRSTISKRPMIDKRQLRAAALELVAIPNPFQQQTQINYVLPKTTEVAIHLLDINGRMLQNVVPPTLQKAGQYQIELNANNLASGVYLLQLQTGRMLVTEKLVVRGE